MAEHTPAPWNCESRTEAGRVIATDDGKSFVAVWDKSLDGTDFPVDANARLIAAAPDLLAALEGTLQVLDKRLEQAQQNAHYPSEFKPENSPSPSEAKKREAARAALAKARK